MTTTDRIDSAQIRETYETILSATNLSAAENPSLLLLRVLGHVQLLLPEVDAIEPHLEGPQQEVTRHVLAETRRILLASDEMSDRHLRDMAVQCRALLTLQEMASRTARILP